MTPREWTAWMEGFGLREEDEWRRTRTLYSIIFNSNTEPRDRLTPEELISLPSDKRNPENLTEKGVKRLNDEERAEIKRKLGIKE